MSVGRVLVVIDMQNDFCHADGVYGRIGSDLTAIDVLVPRLAAGVQAWRSRGLPIVHVRTEHTPSTDSAAWLERGETSLPCACRAGSWGAQPFGVEIAATDAVVVKSRYSGFYRTTLQERLDEVGAREVLVAGVLTNVCVETTIREGCLRDFGMVMLEDCCGTYDPHAQRASVENVRRYFGTVGDSSLLVRRD